MSGAKRRAPALGRALVAVTVTATAREAAANPPPPKAPFSDPAIEAPARSEAASIVRLHPTACFLLFPSGGALVAPCPPALLGQALGSSIERKGSGVCEHMPFPPGAKGAKTGPLPCPTVLTDVFPAGKVNEASEIFLVEEKKRNAPPPPPWAPPLPARLAPAVARQPEGCGGCATSPAPTAGPTISMAALLLAGARRRRRHART